MAVGVAGFADDARIVAAGGQHEGQFAVVEQMQLVYRTPRRDVVVLGPDANMGTISCTANRPPGDIEAAFGEVVVEIQAAQIFECMRSGRRVKSAFHAIRSIASRARPSGNRGRGDQTRSFERSIWNAPAICAGQISLRRMMSSRKSSWSVGDEQLQLASLGEIGLGGEQGRLEPSSPSRAIAAAAIASNVPPRQ